jgi:hypothetical protein
LDSGDLLNLLSVASKQNRGTAQDIGGVSLQYPQIGFILSNVFHRAVCHPPVDRQEKKHQYDAQGNPAHGKRQPKRLAPENSYRI